LVQTLTSGSTDKIQVYREQMDLSRFGSIPTVADLRLASPNLQVRTHFRRG
jgi:hypothetical protein